MSMFTGKRGKVIFSASEDDTTALNVTDWSMDATCDVEDATVMGTDTYKSYLATWNDWTATVQCRLDSGGPQFDFNGTGYRDGGLGGVYEDELDSLTNDDSEKVQLELWFTQDASDGVIYGPATCTGMSVSVEHSGIPTISYTFQGNGSPEFTTSEPTY